jgi:hypothetical protein
VHARQGMTSLQFVIEVKYFQIKEFQMVVSALNVNTGDLTRALKFLQKLERRADAVKLRFLSGTLTISMGGTSRTLTADGLWPDIICVDGRWVKALATKPMRAAITDLRVHDGKLWARDFAVPCSIESRAVEIRSSLKSTWSVFDAAAAGCALGRQP